MKQALRTLVLALIGLALWYVGVTYLQGRIYGDPTFRAIVDELKTRPELVRALEENGFASFDVGPGAQVAPDGLSGSYWFAATDRNLTTDEIIANASRSPFPTSWAEFHSMAQPPSARAVFQVKWQLVGDDRALVIESIEVGNRVLYDPTPW